MTAVPRTEPRPPPTAPDGLVFAPGSPLQELRRTCLRIAASDATVLLTGETGTGKEVFARLIHAQSTRARSQFVPVNCGAIPEALLESELFGYVRGAFTGAYSSRRGRVALAEGGTLFLDEIGEMPLSLQVKLLRLLQQRTYEPVGSSESVTANFRLVAATNRDLLEEVRLGRFRQDLYYRLNVCPVRLPALRERREDVMPLFWYFWHKRGERRALTPNAVRCLEGYAWPGNVREVENLVERLSVCAEGPVIDVRDLPPSLRGMVTHEEFAAPTFDEAPGAIPPGLVSAPPSFHPVEAAPPAPVEDAAPQAEITENSSEIILPPPAPPVTFDPSLPLPVELPKLLRDLETAYIAKALGLTGGNKKEAAKLLGMGRTTLVEKLRRRNSDTSGT